MQSLWSDAGQPPKGQLEKSLPGQVKNQSANSFRLHRFNYNLDDFDISLPGPIDEYAMPSRHVADLLLDDYFTTVHPFFPIISQHVFCTQYRASYNSADRPSDNWLAVINIIFAIAARRAHLIRAHWCGDGQDDLIYLARARKLGMDDDVLFSLPDLLQVQLKGLIAFYLLSINQINR
jgi:hypothetical protein